MISVVTTTMEGSAVLYQKAAKVSDPLSLPVQELVVEMKKYIAANHGVGLAAPQVGVSLRVCVVKIAGLDKVFINPQITAYSTEKQVVEEGCFSIPGIFLPIVRSQWVQIRFLDEKGVKQKIRLSGFSAAVAQHEIDHLFGILMEERYKEQKLPVGYHKKVVFPHQ